MFSQQEMRPAERAAPEGSGFFLAVGLDLDLAVDGLVLLQLLGVLDRLVALGLLYLDALLGIGLAGLGLARRKS